MVNEETTNPIRFYPEHCPDCNSTHDLSIQTCQNVKTNIKRVDKILCKILESFGQNTDRQ